MEFPGNIIAERLGGSNFGTTDEIYKFERIKRAKSIAIKKNPNMPLIDMGVGEPDSAADLLIVEKLFEEAKKPKNRIERQNTPSKLTMGKVSPNCHASSEKEIGTASAKAPIATWLASSELKLRFILIPNHVKD